MEEESGIDRNKRLRYGEIDENELEPDIEMMANLQQAFDRTDGPTPKLNKGDYVVLKYLYWKTADVPANIADATGYNRTYVHQRLTRLEEWGIVKNRGHGVYELNRDTVDIVRAYF